MKAIPVARAIALALSGVPDWHTAEAMAKTDDPEDVKTVIEQHETAVRVRKSMSGGRGD